MSKMDSTDRLVQILIGMTAIFAWGNGAFMLIDPFGWYEFVGTVKATGPANSHFLRDIGLAYLFSAALLTYAAINPAMRWGSAFAGVLWLGTHGILHIYEVLSGICSPDIFWRDAPGTLGPPLLVIVALAIQIGRKRISPAPIPSRLFAKAFASLSGGKEPYIEDIQRAGGFALEKFQHALPLAMHSSNAPEELCHMAKLGATRAEDCGSCLEIVRGAAIQSGMDKSVVNAALSGRTIPAELRQAFDFGAAIALGTSDADEIGDKIEMDYDRAVRTELSLAAASVRLFPAIKRGLGHATACSAEGFT